MLVLGNTLTPVLLASLPVLVPVLVLVLVLVPVLASRALLMRTACVS